MSAPRLVWVAALALTAAALAWMLALIALRARHDRAAARRAEDRRRIELAFVDLLLGRCDLERALGPYRTQAQLMAERLLDLLSLVRGGDRDVVLEAYRTLGLDAAMRARACRGSSAGRLCCIEALAAFPGRDTELALQRVAAGASPKLRLAALQSLKAVGGTLAIGAVVEGLATDRLELSELTAEFVRELATSDPQATLAALRPRGLSAQLRALLVEGLGASGDYSVLACLIEHAGHAEPHVRAAAVTALGRLMHPSAEAAFAVALEDESWVVRCAAAEAAGAAGLSVLAPRLVQRLSDPIWRVRYRAAAALAELGPAGEAHLRRALAAAVEPACSAASFALAERAAA